MSRHAEGQCRSYAIVALAVAVATGCRSSPGLVQHMEARRIAAALHGHFAKATDAANRAVMADTDELSAAFARDAEQAKQSVQADVEALAPLVQQLRYSEETRLLQEFSTKFAEYRELDRRVLDLAVENTNLKAQRVSFGPAFEAADAFRDDLESTAASTGDRWRVQALENAAVAKVREIQALQAPHIASNSDATMTSLEQRMAAAEAAARTAIDTLAPLAGSAARAHVTDARSDLDRFMTLNAEIVSLSRRNTNVRSLALTLNDKGKLSAECDERLQALEEAMGQRQLGGTR